MLNSPPTVSFDTSAWSRLLVRRPYENAVRHKLRRDVRTHEIEVVLTWALLAEIAPTLSDAEVSGHRSIRELRRLGGARVIAPLHERIEAELRRGDRLRRRERLLPVRLSRRLFGGTLHRLASAEVAFIAKKKDEYEALERQAQAEVREKFGMPERNGWIRAWRTTPASIVEDWCRDAIEKRVGRNGRAIDPRKIPSMWCNMSYKLARIYLVAVEAEGSGRIDPNDLLDHAHYADGAYSSVVVTEDQRFLRIAQMCPPPRPDVLSFDEWAQRLFFA